jgi:flagellar biosynthesis protein FlhF
LATSAARERDTATLAREVDMLRAMLNEIYASRPPRERALVLLHSAGIEGELARTICAGLGRGKKLNPTALREQVAACLKARIEVRPGIIAQPEPILIACVGASGVGKTTSLAKLAARARLDFGRSVGVISLDTFRVGAVEQWQRYASLLGVPFHVAASDEHFADALQQLHAEVVLVDTAGRPAQGSWILPECLARVSGRKIHVFLVLPAWTRARDAARMLELYGDPKPTEIVITKTDEASVMGGVLHAVLPTRIPIAYLCDGARVPEDIRDAAVESVLEAVFAPTREVSL